MAGGGGQIKGGRRRVEREWKRKEREDIFSACAQSEEEPRLSAEAAPPSA